MALLWANVAVQGGKYRTGMTDRYAIKSLTNYWLTNTLVPCTFAHPSLFAIGDYTIRFERR